MGVRVRVGHEAEGGQPLRPCGGPHAPPFHRSCARQVVGEVWGQLEAEVAHPKLPAARAPELLLHMLALQAEGLPAAEVGALGRGRGCAAIP